MLYIYGRIFCTIRQRSRSHLGEISSASRHHRPTLWAHLATPKAPADDSVDSAKATGTTEEHKLKTKTPKKKKKKKKKKGERTLDIYESLTLVEIHDNQRRVGTTSNDVSSGVTHYVNVRVQVEYVAEADGAQAGADGHQVTAKTNSETEDRCKSNVYSDVHSPGQKERKAARQLGVIMCAFMVCWLPYFIVFLVVAVCPTCIGHSLNNITLWLGYINSTLNPVLYPLCNVKFRRAFAKMLSRRTYRLPCPQHQTYPVTNKSASIQSRY